MFTGSWRLSERADHLSALTLPVIHVKLIESFISGGVPVRP